MKANSKKGKTSSSQNATEVIKLNHENLSNLLDKNLNPKKLFFNTKEAALLLSVTSRTLLDWRNEGLIGFIQIKHVIRYSWEHIQEFKRRNELSVLKK